MRYRTTSATALATIALAAGGFVVGAGSAAKPAAGAEQQTGNKITLQLAASGSGSLDLWSTLPAGQSAAAGGQDARNGARSGGDATGQPAAYRGSLPPEPAAAAPAAPRSASASARVEEPAEEEERGFLARATALITGYFSDDDDEGRDEGRQAYRAELPSEGEASQRRGPADFTRQIAAAGGAAAGAAGKAFKASPGVQRLEGDDDSAFGADPTYDKNYNAEGQVDIYGGKTEVDPPRPLLELGRKQYTGGEYDPNSTVFGIKNPLVPGLAVYGDTRTAVAYNNNKGQELAQIATRLNIDIDFKITGTERIHAFFAPIQDGGEFTRFEFAGDGADKSFNKEFDFEPQTLFFEGDIAAIYGGLANDYQDFDLPFTVGLFPLFLQNGVWADDAIGGAAFSIPARNSAALDISNFDVTFFGAINDVTNPGVLDDDGNLEGNDVNVYGVTAFLETLGGYWEVGYGALHGYNDRDGLLAHFLTAAYSRRWYNTISNSTRVLWNFTNIGDLKLGGDNNDQNVDGFALISENSLITGLPSTLLPYANFFFGYNTPQPLVEDEGILKNVGINFETDALTGFPKLDDTGSNAWGGALGLQYLFDLDQQIVFEVAMVQPFDDPVAGAEDPQYGFGIRYQLPISRAWLIRADATYQILQNEADSSGVRFEVRRKF